MEKNPVLIKSYSLALDISKHIFALQKSKKEFVLTKQLLKSITSISANLYEAQGAYSRKDFLQKVSIAYKEALESSYWLKLLNDMQFINKKQYVDFEKRCNEILKMLNKIKTTTRKNLK